MQGWYAVRPVPIGNRTDVGIEILAMLGLEPINNKYIYRLVILFIEMYPHLHKQSMCL